MAETYLLSGSNLGDKKTFMLQAIQHISKRIGVVKKQSSFYETEPWGFESDNNFLNQIVLVETALNPIDLLKHTLEIENILGRKRIKNQYSSRTIDIDILFYDDLIFSNNELTIPHKRLHERKFTLAPLMEISPGFIHPVFNKTIAQLYKACPDDSEVKKLDGFLAK